MEKRPKMKKTLYIARFCRVFGCQSIENTAKTSVLD
jgi:carbonic anhydrase/acetyltransferase-like protein (isoleucine patch superfamily)